MFWAIGGRCYRGGAIAGKNRTPMLELYPTAVSIGFMLRTAL
jgi:hypothetical protein